MESWLSEQAKTMVQSWEKSLGRFYPQYLNDWTDPHAHYKAIHEQWNHLRAAEWVKWDTYLSGQDLKILDLGAGAGWLSIILSQRQNVERIYALDSSETLLRDMFPPLLQLMGGNSEKITPILGLFTPILAGNGFYDAVVASSAIHHAPDLVECLQEVHRVLKPGGYFIILNEQPYSYVRYTAMVGLRCVKLLKGVTTRQSQPFPRWVSESGIVTDPYLGDRAYSEWQWKQAFTSSGFYFLRKVSPYYPYCGINDPRNKIKLTHYIATKPST